MPGCPLLGRAVSCHVHRNKQLHVLGPFPGKVLNGKQDHVGVGAGGGFSVVLGPTLRGEFVLAEKLYCRGPLRVQDVSLRVPTKTGN